MKQIHDALVRSGRMTVTYNSFRRQLQPIREALKPISWDIKPDDAKHTPPLPTQRVKKPMPPHQSDSKPTGRFHYDPSCKVEDFF